MLDSNQQSLQDNVIHQPVMLISEVTHLKSLRDISFKEPKIEHSRSSSISTIQRYDILL
jgi:hypothetical protein